MRALVSLLVVLASACTGGSPACTAVQCNPATCCGATCAADADCCQGTVCSVGGRCIPSSCVACGELGCLVDFTRCEATCVPPDRCGEVCERETDCGGGARCVTLDAGERRCVPETFEDQCARCGAGGCAFDAATCAVTCLPPDAGAPDAGATSSACTACCEPCETDADCCAGAYCGESAMGGLFCFPTECRTCTYGCTFTCPQ